MIARAAIIGVGLIGGSIGMALRKRGVSVSGYDTDTDHLKTAAARELIGQAAASPGQAVDEAEVVVLAMPVMDIARELAGLEQFARPDALLIDVGSVKAPIVRAMGDLAFPGRAIGGHLIGGNEKSGPTAASDGILREKNFVLCPSDKTSRQSIERAEEFVRLLGANPVILAPDQHDLKLSRTSHVPQFVSTVISAGVRHSDLPFVGSGLQSMVRLAGSEPVMWRDVALANGSNIAAGLRSLAEELQLLADRIEEADGSYIQALMHKGRENSKLVVGDAAA